MGYFFLVGGLTLIAAFFIGRSRMNEKQELDKLMGEAKLVREDLETLLSEVTVVTGEALDRLEEKIEVSKGLLQVPETRVVGGGPGYYGSGPVVNVTSINRKRKKNSSVALAVGREPAPVARPGDGRVSPERYVQVYRMAEEGLNVRQIAERLNMGQGEVKLILNLQHRRT